MAADRITPSFQEAPPKQEEWRRVARIFFRRKLAVFGLVIILGLIFMAIFAPFLAPYDPYLTDASLRLAEPSSEHWLGCDASGRDTLSRIIYASRTSLLVGVGSVGSSMVVGQLLGLIAGYYGGWIFNIIMRAVDTLMSIPMLILGLVISSLLGAGLRNVIIALGVGGISSHTRMMCGQVLHLKEDDYILAARTMGAKDRRIMFAHLFPNAFPVLLVHITIGLGTTILAEAGLSFLGAGVSQPEAAWGSMIADGYRFVLHNPLLSFSPGVALMLTVFGFNMLGDGLRDALDPRLRGTI